jgi:PPOX class probable F420-dependent enzyme
MKLNPDIQDLFDLLARRGYGVLATIRKSGRPQLSNIGYTWDPETATVRIIGAAFRAKTRNLQRDPRASLHVTSEAFDSWLVVDGTAVVTPPCVEEGDEVWEEIAGMYRLMGASLDPEYLLEMPIIDRCVYRISVERIYGGNGTAGLGVSADVNAPVGVN